MKLRITAALLLASLGAADCRAQGCQPYWTAVPVPADDPPGTLAVIPNGAGRVLYADGFGYQQGYLNPVRRWDGYSWAPVGEGLVGDSVEQGLRALDLGQGLQLVFTGVLVTTPYMKRWTGALWEDLPSTMYYYTIHSNHGPLAKPLFSFDQSWGSVAGLYGFVEPGDSTKQVARWTGTAWSPVGVLAITDVFGTYPMITYREGQTDYLVIAGGFERISGVIAHDLARWDGTNWSAMGTPPTAAEAMCIFDDGTGASLYIGYDGQPGAGLAVEGIARWSGADWVSVGGGVRLQGWGYGGVRALCVFDDGSGPALFAAGTFDTAGGVPARQIAKWDGHVWSALGRGIAGLPAQLVVADDVRGESLFVAANISFAGGGTVYGLAQWVGCHGGQCYANCDNSTAPPKLNINDFLCFLNAFARQDPYANCDVSTAAPFMNVADFMCFLNKFAAGCP